MAIVGDWKAQVIGQPGDWAGNKPALPALLASVASRKSSHDKRLRI